MSYPFIPAPDSWPRTAPIRAIVIHMAEGGGTVSWLQRPDGNSSHYVVERTGRIVQMVREDRAAGSIDPTKVRTNDDSAYTYLGESIVYGVTANKAALGDAWRNPNAAVIAIEVEGFARVGPGSAQRGSLKSLVADIRTRHNVPVLGHRDFQNYKACPGKLIPWADYGGHGKQEEDVPGLAVKIDAPIAGTVTVKPGLAGVKIVQIADREMFDPPPDGKHAYLRGTMLSPDFYPGREVYVVGDEAAVVLADQFTFKADPITGGDVKHKVAIAVDGLIVTDTEVMV